MTILRIAPLIVAFLLPFSAFAADIRTAENIFISSNEYISENAYFGGAEINIAGSLSRDAVIAGGKLILNGSVGGDALIAGGTIDILSRVQGDVRAAGGQITIAAPVGGDVIIVGGSTTILAGSVVAGDVVVLGGKVTIDGAVNGNVKIYAGTVAINGLIGGDAVIKAGEKVSFGEHAVIGKALSYTAPAEATIHESAKLGDKITFTELEAPARSLGPSGIAAALAAFAVMLLLAKLVIHGVTAILFVLLFPGFSRIIVEYSLQNFWKATGVGFAALILIPVAILFLAVTVIGLMAAVILGTLYGLVLLLASVYAAITLGALCSQWTRGQWNISWKWALVGVLVLFVVSLVPFVGWLAALIFFLSALGTITLEVYRRALGGM